VVQNPATRLAEERDANFVDDKLLDNFFNKYIIMKNSISISLVLILFGILFFASCAKEDPANPNDPTSTDPRAKFLGHWYVTENSQIYNGATYYSDITDSTNASYILLSGLYGFNFKTHATVSGNNFTIPSQAFPVGTISGNGVLSNSTNINLKYYVRTGTNAYDTVTAIFTK
jgi:hypothetical protein